jgi:hypothetical protein
LTRAGGGSVSEGAAQDGGGQRERERRAHRPRIGGRPATGAASALPKRSRPGTVARTVADDLIRPGEVAYRLELTAAQLKIVHTALKSLYDDLGHEEGDFKQVVASVLDKLPGEHEIRAIDLTRELRDSEQL